VTDRILSAGAIGLVFEYVVGSIKPAVVGLCRRRSASSPVLLLVPEHPDTGPLVRIVAEASVALAPSSFGDEVVGKLDSRARGSKEGRWDLGTWIALHA
jgi:hypothetical protein